MCDTCGCGQAGNEITFRKPGEGSSGPAAEGTSDIDQHIHSHGSVAHSHVHSEGSHNHSHPHGRTIELQSDILQRNNLSAERNRGYFEGKNIFALNLVSSPGSGKTSLLERTITDLKNEIDFFVVEGDQQTMNDADRINAVGAPVIQINTGSGCHLDADMIRRAYNELGAKENSIMMIENVGNLVCPALFDLGEARRVVIISVTEGTDKPLKYPTMFHSSHLCLINKTDLLPYVDFDVAKTIEYARSVNPNLEFIQISLKNGQGIDHWYNWLRKNRTAKMH